MPLDRHAVVDLRTGYQRIKIARVEHVRQEGPRPSVGGHVWHFLIRLHPIGTLRLVAPQEAQAAADVVAEKAILEVYIAKQPIASPTATILPHPVLLRHFEQKVGKLCETSNAEAVRGAGAEVLSTLIGNVTIYPEGEHGPDAASR